MPDPVAPRKRGALTSSAVASSASTSRPARQPVERNGVDELADRLQSATLGDASRKLTSTTIHVRPARSLKPVVAVTAAASPKEAIASESLEAVNKAIASINGTRNAESVRLNGVYKTISPHIDRLRTLGGVIDARKRLEVEKAALILVGACNDAGLYALSAQQLRKIRLSLCCYYAETPVDSVSDLGDRLAALSTDDAPSVASEAASRTASRTTSANSRSTSSAKQSAGTAEKDNTDIWDKDALDQLVELVHYPTPSPSNSEDVYNLVLIAQHHAISMLLSLPVSSEMASERIIAVHRALTSPSSGNVSPLALSAAARSHLDNRKKLDGSIAAIYSLLNRKLSELSTLDATSDALFCIFQLRIYAIECLLEFEAHFAQPAHFASADAAPATEDKAIDTFAASAMRALSTYARSFLALTGSNGNDSLAEKIANENVRLLKRAMDVVRPRERLSRNKQFSAFLDTVNKLVKRSRTGCKGLQDVVTQLLAVEPAFISSIEAPTLKESTLDPRQVVSDIAARCNRLLDVCSEVERWIKHGASNSETTNQSSEQYVDKYRIQIGELATYLTRFTIPLPAESASALSKAVERMRYHPERALRTAMDDSTGQTAGCAISSASLEGLLLALASLVQSASAHKSEQMDILLAGMADTYFLLARRALKVEEPQTYKIAYGHLDQVSSTLDLYSSPIARLETARYLASNAHHLGVRLYNEQKFANAIPFLQACCNVMSKVIWIEDGENGLSASHINAARVHYSDLLNQAVKRWELLGLAHHHIREWSDAASSFASALRAAHSLSIGVDGPTADILDNASTIRKIVGRYCRIVTFELLAKPEDSSLSLETNRWPAISTAAKAKLLEMQARSLDSCLHKVEAVTASEHWLGEALLAFRESGDTHGVLRILLRQMELSATMSGYLDANALAQCADQVRKVYNSDVLAAYAPYLAFARVFVALDAIRRKVPTASKMLAKEAKEALALLRNCVSSSAKSSSSPPTKVKQASSAISTIRPKTISRTVKTTAVVVMHGKTATRKPLSPKGPTKAHANRQSPRVVTPPKREALSPCNAQRQPASSNCKLAACDSDILAGNISILVTLASLLGLFGHTFLKIQVLRLLRQVCHDTSNDCFVEVSGDLMTEYSVLGKMTRAHSVLASTLPRLASQEVCNRTRVLFLLRQVAFLSMSGHNEASFAAYNEALRVSNQMTQNLQSDGAGHERIIARAQILYCTAFAAHVYSMMVYRLGSASQALSAALQAVRVANRAIVSLARLTNSATDTTCSPNATTTSANAVEAPQPRKVLTSGASTHTLITDVTTLLSEALLWTANVYTTRGSMKPALYFLQQANDLAKAMNTPRLEAKIVGQQVHLAMSTGESAVMEESFERLRTLAASDGGLSTIYVTLIKAEKASLAAMHDEATSNYSMASLAVDKLDKTFFDNETSQSSPPRLQVVANSPGRKKAMVGDFILPTLQAAILQSQIKHIMTARVGVDIGNLLVKLKTVLTLPMQQSVGSALESRVRYMRLVTQIRCDPILGLLSETAASVPPLTVSGVEAAMTAEQKDLIAQLTEIQLLYIGATMQYPACWSPSEWRRLSFTIAQLEIWQAILGHSVPGSSVRAARLIESGTAITLKREMRDASEVRCTGDVARDDLRWPVQLVSPLAASETRPKGHLNDICERYTAITTMGNHVPVSPSTYLPPGWIAVSIHLTEDKTSLTLVRYQKDREPNVLSLPLDRLGLRDAEDELFEFECAKAEMDAIITGANETCSRAKECSTEESRRVWWKQRKALELRLATLLTNIEQRWFGVFKHFLCSVTQAEKQMSAAGSARIEEVLQRNLLGYKQPNSGSIRLNRAMLEIIACLDKSCSDEDFEDLLHYVVDAYQFCGAYVAWDEIDLDQAIIDLRSVLDEEASDQMAEVPHLDEHLILVLDSPLHNFPWESVPFLAKRSISRLPALSFLQDRLVVNATAQSMDSTCSSAASPRVHYTLDPGGDLKHTKNEFGAWLKQHGWSGSVGRPPMEEELKRALVKNDIHLYFGHGGAEQYIRPQTVRHLPKCATTLLLGCSSGYLPERGEFEATGTPWTYILAGAPAVLGNLWDVTDKDIDRFAKATFEEWGLGTATEKLEKTSLSMAVARARGSCHLRYLNGAAPIIWGIPVYC